MSVRPRLLGLLALVAAVYFSGSTPAAAWGATAQQAVVQKAIDTLPKGIKPFYRNHRFEMASLALEPTFPDDSPERRFAIDRLMPWPFTDLPHTEKALKERFPDQADSLGRLPWLIQESYGLLKEAFKSGDKVKILSESDRLALLVADIHNPLALSDNADGQKTGQHGLWIRFGVKFPEAMKDRLKVQPDAANFLDDPDSYVFSMMESSYVWLDNVLYADTLARRGKPGYGEIFFESFEIRASSYLADRLARAAEDAGSYWYTAWTAAGRPDLK